MKSILISIQPKWCELIASGKKTIEVRKTRPKLETPFKVYIYCTKSTDRLLYFSCNNKVLRTTKSKYIHGIERTCKIFSGKIIGEFVCDAFITDKTFGHDSLFNAVSCMSDAEIAAYCTNKEMFGWHISNLKIYDKPKELSEFCIPCEESLTDKTTAKCKRCKYLRKESEMSLSNAQNCVCDGVKPVIRPPQSWCYVEKWLA